MLQVTNERVSALMYLRDVVIPWMKDNPKAVDLDECVGENSCGTYACLGGWYALMRYDRALTIDEIDEHLEADFGALLVAQFPDTYMDRIDINDHQSGWYWTGACPLFGYKEMGGLDVRLELIDKILEKELVNAAR